MQRRREESDTMFFSKSPQKRIDYVLVYGKDAAEDPRRKEFEDELRKSGLELELEDIKVGFNMLPVSELMGLTRAEMKTVIRPVPPRPAPTRPVGLTLTRDPVAVQSLDDG